MMRPTLSPQEFVEKWRSATLKERSAAQEHFIDVCYLVGHQTPAEADPAGTSFGFEYGASKERGGQGWADVWKKGRFAWEYKGKRKNLDAAYQQLLQYRESLLNPPLLVVSDMERIVIHTNFTNTVKQVVELRLDDLLQPERLALLRAVFVSPETFQVRETTELVTQKAAASFACLADQLRKVGEDPQRTAHFLIRLLFCLFAEDVRLLPEGLFTRLIAQARHRPQAFAEQLRQLFAAMAGGGWFGADEIAHFDGRLFDDDVVLELVVAYCLMPNHFHFLLSPGDDGLSRRMQRLSISYTKAVNERHQRTGSLFEGQFQAVRVDGDDYLLHLSRYIHLNPVLGGLVRRPEDWEFSSYREFIGVRAGTLPRPEVVLAQVGGPADYRTFVEGYEPRDWEKIAGMMLDED